MGVKVLTWAFQQSLKPRDKVVLLALADYACDDGTCYPALKTIAKKASVSVPTVTRVLAALEDYGLLTREQRFRKDGSQRSTLYTLALGGVSNCNTPVSDVKEGCFHSDGGGVSTVKHHEPLPMNHSVTNVTGAFAPFEAIDGDWKAALFGPCLAWVAEQENKPPDKLRSFVGRCLQMTGGDARAVRDVFAAARAGRVAAPVDWITAHLGGKKQRNGPPSVMEAIERA